MARVRGGVDRDPWRRARSEELAEQLWPRWFAILVVALIPIAIVVFVLAFTLFTPEEVAPAEQRPAPAGAFAHDVGATQTTTEADAGYEVETVEACPALDGIQVAGTPAQRADLRRSVAATCNALPGGDADDALAALAGADAILRYAEFQRTGVDSTLWLDGSVPEVLVNARFSVSDEILVAPLIVHDAVVFAGGVGEAEVALAARRAEAQTCARVLGAREPSAGCSAAAALIDDPGALDALRAVGYR